MSRAVELRWLARVRAARYPVQFRDDLIADAYLALVIADLRHDPSRGAFFPYAARQVDRALIHGLRRISGAGLVSYSTSRDAYRSADPEQSLKVAKLRAVPRDVADCLEFLPNRDRADTLARSRERDEVIRHVLDEVDATPYGAYVRRRFLVGESMSVTAASEGLTRQAISHRVRFALDLVRNRLSWMRPLVRKTAPA